MDSKSKKDMLIAVLAVAGNTYIIGQAFYLIGLIFSNMKPNLLKLLLIPEIVLVLLVGLYIWKKIELSQYFSKTFLILLVATVILKLTHYLLMIF